MRGKDGCAFVAGVSLRPVNNELCQLLCVLSSSHVLGCVSLTFTRTKVGGTSKAFQLVGGGARI